MAVGSNKSGGLIGTLRAFGWLRWRLLVNRLRSAKRRDLLGRLTRWGDLIGLALMALALLPLLPSITVGSVALGWAMASGRIPALSGGPATNTFRGVLFIFVLLALILPVTIGVQRGTTATQRLLLLPIERSRLHLTRLLSALVDPVLLFGGVALLLFPVGLAIGGRPGTGAFTLAAGVLLILTLAALTVTIEAVLPRLLRRRRRRDTILILLSSAAVLLSLSLLAIDEESIAGVLTEGIFLINVPGELYIRVLFEGLAERYAASALALLGLTGLTLLCYRLWTRAHERVLRPEGESRKRGAVRRQVSTGGRFQPANPTQAVAATQLRTLTRTVTGKMALVQGSFGAVMAAIVASRTDQLLPAVEELGPELLPLGAALVLTCLGMLPLLFNQFAVDRAGLSLSFLLPLSSVQLLRGRLLALCAIGGTSMWLSWVVTMVAIRPSVPRLFWSAVYTALATSSVLLLLGTIGALVSTLFPRAVDLGQAFQHNQPHSIATLVGMAATAFTTGIPALLVLAGLAWFRSPLWATALLAIWLLFSLALAALLTNPSSALLSRRRESLLLVAAETRSR